VIQKPDQYRAVEVPQKGLKNCLDGVLLSKERPAVDAWNCSIFGRPAFLFKTFNAIAKNGNAIAKNGETTCMGNRKKDS